MNSTDSAVAAERPGDDFLMGASAIAEYLRGEGLDVTEADVYYLARAKKLTIGKFGKSLLGSKMRLSRELQRAAKALTP
jgi:hypothetical protein